MFIGRAPHPCAPHFVSNADSPALAKDPVADSFGNFTKRFISGTVPAPCILSGGGDGTLPVFSHLQWQEVYHTAQSALNQCCTQQCDHLPTGITSTDWFPVTCTVSSPPVLIPSLAPPYLPFDYPEKLFTAERQDECVIFFLLITGLQSSELCPGSSCFRPTWMTQSTEYSSWFSHAY